MATCQLDWVTPLTASVVVETQCEWRLFHFLPAFFFQLYLSVSVCWSVSLVPMFITQCYFSLVEQLGFRQDTFVFFAVVVVCLLLLLFFVGFFWQNVGISASCGNVLRKTSFL